jgi:hypothetical protein
MNNVRVINTTVEQDRASVIETLEDALEDAKAGNIRSVAIAVVRPDLALNACWSDSDSAAPLIGAVALLQKRLIEALDD